ncbi:hypothetical protein RBSH_04792 [Rhodopirellula baltica SH28]|uniref:Uncharacterized protein n=2 Tax=Rhodopirellula baltica TaxID=265606 RepID=K5DA70_RHOBT|nr:hypothetical protein RBSH_04792 [Rhodopirellula baltica SH28]ELP34079.1 hypothetical protein RBSWK_02215 [Rhodopirellula baltica SWK14]
MAKSRIEKRKDGPSDDKNPLIVQSLHGSSERICEGLGEIMFATL